MAAQSSADVLEGQREARLRALGASPAAIEASKLRDFPEKADAAIRVMQYNLLADGLSGDGFLVKMILDIWKEGGERVPVSGGASAPFSELVAEMLAARHNKERKEELLKELKAKYDHKLSVENARVVVDFEARKLQLALLILRSRPDVVVLQELDHYADVADVLKDIGYTAEMPKRSSYVPAHWDGLSDTDDASRSKFEQEWARRGHAFLPHLNSTCMSIALDNIKTDGAETLEAAVMDVAEASGLKTKVCKFNEKTKKDGLTKAWPSKLGGTKRLFEDEKLSERITRLRTLDDMGVAVFWRSDAFEAQSLAIRVYKGGGGGIVKVGLKQHKTGKVLTVMGTHLKSGDTAEDEQKRMTTQVDNGSESCLAAWLREALADKDSKGVIVSLDANSHPQMQKTEQGNVWTSLRGVMGASVWDDAFDEAGGEVRNEEPPLRAEALRSGAGLEAPVTTNKVRGPLSGQSKKIGLHAYYLIDHVFFAPDGLDFVGHVKHPMQYKSEAAALEDVQPSLANPSDHFPVIADLAWSGDGEKLRFRGRQTEETSLLGRICSCCTVSCVAICGTQKVHVPDAQQKSAR